MSRLRTHLAIAAFAAFTATATTALVAGVAEADRNAGSLSRSDVRAENAQLRAELAYFEAAHLELTRGLERIEQVGQRSSDPRTQAAIQRIVDNTRNRVGRFIGDDQRPLPSPRPDDRPATYPMLSSSDFDRLVTRIKGTFNGTDAVEVVRTAATGSYFNVDQALTLLKACTYESARVEMAIVLYPRIVDLNRWFLIDEAFTYPSSRATVRQRVQQLQSQTQGQPQTAP